MSTGVVLGIERHECCCCHGSFVCRVAFVPCAILTAGLKPICEPCYTDILRHRSDLPPIRPEAYPTAEEQGAWSATVGEA